MFLNIKGLTFAEVLIVILMMVLLAAISLPAMFHYRSNQELKNMFRVMEESVSLAQSLAKTSEHDLVFMVQKHRFGVGVMEGSRVRMDHAWTPLPRSIEFDEASLNAPSLRFRKGTGRLLLFDGSVPTNRHSDFVLGLKGSQQKLKIQLFDNRMSVEYEE